MSTPPNRRGLLTRLLTAKTPEEIEAERLKLLDRQASSAGSRSLPRPGSESPREALPNPPKVNLTRETTAPENDKIPLQTTAGSPNRHDTEGYPQRSQESVGGQENLIHNVSSDATQQGIIHDETGFTRDSESTTIRNMHSILTGDPTAEPEMPATQVFQSDVRIKPQKSKATPVTSAKRGITPVDKSFDLSLHLRRVRELYRLNRTELTLYETFLRWTHAIGKPECEATNRKISEENGLSEKNIRRGLKTLRTRGLIIQIKAYDPFNHEPAIFLVHLSSSLQ